MAIDFTGVSRDRTAELLCCQVLTPSVELQAQSAAVNRSRSGKAVQGYAVVFAGLRAAELRAAAVVRDWMLAHEGETPNIEALIDAE